MGTVSEGWQVAAVMLVLIGLPIAAFAGYLVAIYHERRWADWDAPWSWGLERARRCRRDAILKRAEELVALGIRWSEAQRLACAEIEASAATAKKDYEESMKQAGAE